MSVMKTGGLLGREKGTEEIGRDGMVREEQNKQRCNNIYENITTKFILCAEQNNYNKKMKRDGRKEAGPVERSSGHCSVSWKGIVGT